MQNYGKFFGALVRFNILAIAVVGVVALLALGRAGLEWVNSIVPIPHLQQVLHPGAVVESANSLKIEDGYVLNPTSYAITKGDETLYELQRVTSYSGYVNPEVPGTKVNYLAVNPKTNANHWLFKGHNRAILSGDPVFAPAAAEEGGRAEPFVLGGFAMVVAEADTNKDGSIGAGDRVALYVYRMDGKTPVKVLEADKITMAQTYDTRSALVFYQDGKQTFAATFSVPDYKLVKQVPVADMPAFATPLPTPAYFGGGVVD